MADTMMVAVKRLLRESGLSDADMADALGTTRQNVHNKLSGNMRADLKSSVAARMLDVLGYKLVIMPKGKRTPDGCIEVVADEV